MNRILLSLIITVLTLSIIWANNGVGNSLDDDPFMHILESVAADTLPPIDEREGDFISDPTDNPFDLNDPGVIQQEVEYDAETGLYLVTEKIGDEYYKAPTYMTFEEYLKYTEDKQRQEYFDRLSRNTSEGFGNSGIPDPMEEIEVKENMLDKLFGGKGIKIDPKGSIDLTLGADYQKVENPIIPERQRRQGGFDFDMNIQMNVTGQIGDKMKLGTSYNTQATFDFENQMKLEYAGGEDDIIQKLEAGNVSFPLRSSLIKGSQSLFGVKTELRFGRMTLSAVASQQKSKRNEIQIQGGSQVQNFEVSTDNYDENRHFFISHFNRGTFEQALEQMPQIRSLFTINRMEVWVTNTRNQTENVRDIVALSDLGEGNNAEIGNTNPLFQAPIIPVDPDITGTKGLPTNQANPMFDIITSNPQARNIDGAVSQLQNVYQLQQAKDFEKVRARMLSTNEFSFNPELGFLSLNVALQPEDVLGVAMEFTYNGELYKIGEFTNDVPVDPDTLNVLYVKMLKSTTPRVDIPMWDLMMKNVYSIGAFQVSREDFVLDISYEDPGGGEKRFLPATALEGKPLLEVFNLDNLNNQNDPQPDGRFDFVEGVTINSRNGRIMFPVLEPFGSNLKQSIIDASPVVTPTIEAEAAQYTYPQLYDSTIIAAREYPEFNRFTIWGTYRSSVSSEISLGAFNIPRGSVVVRAGGQVLQEGSDYTIDYNIGRVKILNESFLNSGVPINVSFEDNTLFGFQTKTLLGLRADYKINDNFNVGATVMKLYERPFTQKVNIGDDPINNSIYGADIQYTTEAPWVTKMVDALPLIQTKAPSQISFMAEGAYLNPGHAKAISQEDQGVVYVDDFEGSTSSLDLRTPANSWTLASIPQDDQFGNNPEFPESQFIDTTLSGVNRARLTWYQIDRSINATGVNENAYTSAVSIQEIFPNTTLDNPTNNTIRTLDLTYHPEQKGPYNFDVPGGTDYSAGMGSDGELLEPETRWGGIQRSLNTNNFEAANVEFMEFWVLSPFLPEPDGSVSSVSDGELNINLGNISEDVLRDSRLFFENGLPAADDDETRTDSTSWSRIPRVSAITRSFDNDEAVRNAQDVGLDGMNDEGELAIYADYVNTIQNASGIPNTIKEQILADVANDNFVYYNDDRYGENDDVFDRYFHYNNPQGNSAQSVSQVNSATNIPDSEDINKDNTLNETESYYQYKIPVKRANDAGEMELNDFVIESATSATNGRIWYRIKVPIDQYTSRVGGIQDFRSIRFIRMFMTDFSTSVTMRFARFELVRNQWRRYRRSMAESGIGTEVDENDETIFDVNEVNLEENSAKQPFNYVLPPGVEREQQVGSAYANSLQNEQSLAINICNLKDSDSRGIFKNLNLDLRLFKELKMFIHAENVAGEEPNDPGELAMFVRLGSDFEKNYYEYEIPLTMSTENSSDPESDEYKEEVWLEANRLSLKLELLQQAKTERNGTNSPLNFLYTIEDPDNPLNSIGVKGNPNLGLVKSIMIGVKNTKDDGLSRCAEIWVNELRMSGFDERGGWGALARLDVQLADFGNVNVSTNYTSIGFGGLEQKLEQRSREEQIQYDVAGNVELGKFFPEKAGIKIPVYAQYSNTTKNPQYDPYDLDIELKDKLDAAEDKETRQEIKKAAQDVTKIKSVNITNVRKERTNTKKKPMPWDVENLSLTYAYSNTERRTPLIENDQLKDHQAILDYNYSRKVTYFTPFKKVIKKPKVAKYFKFFTDFNFNPYPNSFAFSTRMQRQIQSTTYRFSDPSQSTWYNRKFNWDRSYDTKWDLAKSLKVTYNAVTNAVIDELDDEFIGTKEAREEIKSNIKDWGRNKNFQQGLNVTYDLPFKHIPFLDFIKVKAQYNANFSWQAAALNGFDVDNVSLGNIIQNGQTRQINGDLNFETLYNKSKYLKKINTKNKKPNKTGRTGNRAKDLLDKKKDADKKDDLAGDKDGKGDKKGKKDKKKKEDKEPTAVTKALLRPLMMVRKGRFTYSEKLSSIVPGFMPNQRMLGMNQDFTAPGWDYVFGLKQADQAWLEKNQTWISESVYMNQQVLNTYTQDISAKLTVEPFNDFIIDIEADRKISENSSAYYKKTHPDSAYQYLAPRDMGSFQMSFFTMGTLFNKDPFAIFQQFETNREIISSKLNDAYGNGNTALHEDDQEFGNYYQGFGRYQLDVLVPAFLAAYTGQDANSVAVDLLRKDPSKNNRPGIFRKIPLPNWRLTYKGLHKIPALKKIFSSVTIQHGYKSRLNINSFNTDQDYDGVDARNDNTGNYYSEYEVPGLVISEQLSPLIGIDMRFKNDLTARLDWKKSRNLAMSFTDYQLSETRSDEFIIGLGYRLKNVYIKFLDFGDFNGKKLKKKKNKGKDDDNKDAKSKDKKGSDVNFKFDFSWRDDITVNHLLDQGVSVPTRGMKSIRISPSIDYAINKQLSLRLFYDYSRTIPATSASFPITNTSAGLQIRFSLN